MPQNLHRTWTALALAALAVVVVAFLTGRDFVRDVYAPCAESITPASFDMTNPPELTRVFFDASDPELTTPTNVSAGRTYRLRFDTKQTRFGYGPGSHAEYGNVRIVLSEGADGKACACGTVPITLSGETPFDLQLFRVEGDAGGDDVFYVVKGRALPVYEPGGGSDVRMTFKLHQGLSSQLQTDRILTTRHLSSVVVLLALAALGVALLRARRAISYALRMHTWTEAHLANGGIIEGENGGTLGTLEQTRSRSLPSGPVLVAPDALTTSGLYRDVPIIARENVVEGDHARWSHGTRLRLRDARVLAVISTLSASLAFAAHFIA